MGEDWATTEDLHARQWLALMKENKLNDSQWAQFEAHYPGVRDSLFQTFLRNRLNSHPFLLTANTDDDLSGVTINTALGLTKLFTNPHQWCIDNKLRVKFMPTTFVCRIQPPNPSLTDMKASVHIMRDVNVCALNIFPPRDNPSTVEPSFLNLDLPSTVGFSKDSSVYNGSALLHSSVRLPNDQYYVSREESAKLAVSVIRSQTAYFNKLGSRAPKLIEIPSNGSTPIPLPTSHTLTFNTLPIDTLVFQPGPVGEEVLTCNTITMAADDASHIGTAGAPLAMFTQAIYIKCW